MQFTAALLAAMSATSTLATPIFQSVDNSVKVELIREGHRDTVTAFNQVAGGQREEQAPRHMGPFTKVNLEVGKGVQKQDLRCQVLDEAGKPIVILRDPNTDITFSDADKGAWTFQQESSVSKIVCDPAFVKVGADALDVTVKLSGPEELATQTVFKKFPGGRQFLPPTGSAGPYDTVELEVGELVANQDLRCQVVLADGTPVIMQRKANVDKTFSDKNGGDWKFVKPAETEITAVICDDSFVAEKVQI